MYQLSNSLFKQTGGILFRQHINFSNWKCKLSCICNIFVIFLFTGTVYLTGGSDGSQSLKSTEILTPDRGWVMGPSLSIPRANVGVVTCVDRLFAVGGFSGKKFLDSMEFLSDIHEEWCCYLPVENSVIAEKMAKRKSGAGSKNLDQNCNCDETLTTIPRMKTVNGHWPDLSDNHFSVRWILHL